MSYSLSLSGDGQYFVHTCYHCKTPRQERVNPALNPLPFSYMPICTGCTRPLEIDDRFIANVQASFARACSIAKKIPAPMAIEAGFKGGESKKPGSPAYSAFSRADADTTVAGAGLEPATSGL